MFAIKEEERTADQTSFIRVNMLKSLKDRFHHILAETGNDMTGILVAEIHDYLNRARLNIDALVEARLKNSPPPSDSKYTNKEINHYDKLTEGNTYVGIGMEDGDKQFLSKICDLRQVTVSALIRTIISKYVEVLEGIEEISITPLFDLILFSSKYVHLIQGAKGAIANNPSATKDNHSVTIKRRKVRVDFKASVPLMNAFRRVLRREDQTQTRVLRKCIKNYLESPDSITAELLEPNEQESENWETTHISVPLIHKKQLDEICALRGIELGCLIRAIIQNYVNESGDDIPTSEGLIVGLPQDLDLVLTALGKRRGRRKATLVKNAIISFLNSDRREVTLLDEPCEVYFEVALSQEQIQQLQDICNSWKVSVQDLCCGLANSLIAD